MHNHNNNLLELELETKCNEIVKVKISKAEAASIDELKEKLSSMRLLNLIMNML